MVDVCVMIYSYGSLKSNFAKKTKGRSVTPYMYRFFVNLLGSILLTLEVKETVPFLRTSLMLRISASTKNENFGCTFLFTDLVFLKKYDIVFLNKNVISHEKQYSLFFFQKHSCIHSFVYR